LNGLLSFRNFVDEATSLTNEACKSVGYEPPPQLDWDIPPSKSLGDVSFRVGYQLAKTAKKRPAEVVAELAAGINGAEGKKKFVLSAEGHPSGFLNFRFNDKELFTAVLLSAEKNDYGKIDLGKKSSVIVEHTSVNPNKALHIGHLRNVALGDSIARIFKFADYDVRVLNYIDDSGLQVADVLVGLMFLGHPKEPPSPKKYDHYAGDDVYVNVTKQYETNPSLKEKQKYVLKAMEEHDLTVFPLAAEITDRVLREQLKTCWRFNATYDLLGYESDILRSKLWEEVLSQLKARGIAKLETEGKFEGCWIVTVKGEKEGEDKVLVRSDGTATYVAKDIPLAALKTGLISDRFTYTKYIIDPWGKTIWRTNSSGEGEKHAPVKWGADKSITPIDARQARLQRVILHVLEQLASRDLSTQYIHLGYTIVSLSQKTAVGLNIIEKESSVLEHDEDSRVSGAVTMSGRKGAYINADDLFDLLKQRALEETVKRNPDAGDKSWLDEVAETIAISAIRFSLLKQDLDKMIVFDLDDSLKLVGETGPYMLYSFARASSILSKFQRTENAEIKGELLSSESEKDLITVISKFDLAVEKSVKMLAPKWVAHYSFELCESFNKFYEKNRVLQVEDPDMRNSRIALVRAFANVLETSLDLLGIRVLPKI
jgi:arginyl-tRNA synthetase